MSDEDSIFPRDKRSLILDRLAAGGMSLSQARDEAERAGVQLDYKTAQHLDPMEEPWWTPLMALAWIIWRSPTQVAQLWKPYCDENPVFQSGPPTSIKPGKKYDPEADFGWQLVSRDPGATKLAVMVCLTKAKPDGAPMFKTIEGAQKDLWSRLEQGEISAKGTSGEDHKRSSISPDDWRHMDLIDAAGIWSEFWSKRLEFYDVALHRSKILETWPAIKMPMPTVSDEKACQQELVRMMKGSPNEPRSKKAVNRNFLTWEGGPSNELGAAPLLKQGRQIGPHRVDEKVIAAPNQRTSLIAAAIMPTA